MQKLSTSNDIEIRYLIYCTFCEYSADDNFVFCKFLLNIDFASSLRH